MQILENKPWKCLQIKVIGISRMAKKYGIHSTSPPQKKIWNIILTTYNLYKEKKQ